MKNNKNPKVIVSFMIDRDIFRQFLNDCEENKVNINQALVELVIWQNETIKTMKDLHDKALMLNEDLKNVYKPS